MRLKIKDFINQKIIKRDIKKKIYIKREKTLYNISTHPYISPYIEIFNILKLFPKFYIYFIYKFIV